MVVTVTVVTEKEGEIREGVGVRNLQNGKTVPC